MNQGRRNCKNFKKVIMFLLALIVLTSFNPTSAVEKNIANENVQKNLEISNFITTTNNSTAKILRKIKNQALRTSIKINVQLDNIAYQAGHVVDNLNYYEARKSLSEAEKKMAKLMKEKNFFKRADFKKLQNATKKIYISEQYVYQLETTEIYMLAKAIHGEAGVCDKDEKYRVGTVVMNRVESDLFQSNVEKVLKEGYSCYMNDLWFKEEPTQEEFDIAIDIIINGTRTLPKNVFYQSKIAYGTIIFESKWHQYGAL